jgi:hypothetical protein
MLRAFAHLASPIQQASSGLPMLRRASASPCATGGIAAGLGE